MRLKICRERSEVRLDGKRIELTKIQFNILEVLLKADGQIVSRTELTKRVWGWSPRIQRKLKTNTVTQQLSRLRRRLGGRLVQTVVGRGYMINRD